MMKKINQWDKPVILLTVALSAVSSFAVAASPVLSATTANALQASATASSPSQDNIQLAQGLIGQCRAANNRIFVYTQRSTSSQTIRTLAPNERVTLADNGSGGWIAISAPVTGYVQANSLKPCTGGSGSQTGGGSQAGSGSQGGGSSQNPGASNVCRRVIVAEGLTVRQNPNSTAVPVGGVFSGNIVKLVSPQKSEKDAQGRTWVQIVTPRAGWISSGFPSGNLSEEFTCP